MSRVPSHEARLWYEAPARLLALARPSHQWILERMFETRPLDISRREEVLRNYPDDAAINRSCQILETSTNYHVLAQYHR